MSIDKLASFEREIAKMPYFRRVGFLDSFYANLIRDSSTLEREQNMSDMVRAAQVLEENNFKPHAIKLLSETGVRLLKRLKSSLRAEEFNSEYVLETLLSINKISDAMQARRQESQADELMMFSAGAVIANNTYSDSTRGSSNSSIEKQLTYVPNGWRSKAVFLTIPEGNYSGAQVVLERHPVRIHYFNDGIITFSVQRRWGDIKKTVSYVPSPPPTDDTLFSSLPPLGVPSQGSYIQLTEKPTILLVRYKLSFPLV